MKRQIPTGKNEILFLYFYIPLGNMMRQQSKNVFYEVLPMLTNDGNVFKMVPDNYKRYVESYYIAHHESDDMLKKIGIHKVSNYHWRGNVFVFTAEQDDEPVTENIVNQRQWSLCDPDPNLTINCPELGNACIRGFVHHL